MFVRFAHRSAPRLVSAHGEADARLLHMGKLNGELVRIFPEAARQFRSGTLDASVRRFYAIEDDALRLHDELFHEPQSLDGLDVAVEVVRGARRITHAAPLERWPTLGRLVPLLTGRFREAEVWERVRAVATHDEFAWSRKLFDAWQSAGALEVFQRAPASNSAMPNVRWLGHATLVFESRERRVVVDPAFFSEHGSSPEAFGLSASAVDAIIVSHSHWDHLHLSTLLAFDKDIPVYIPRVRAVSAFNPSLRVPLERLGFTRIHEITNEPVRVGDIEVFPFPFHGEEDEPGEPMDHLTYALSTPGLCIYAAVDSGAVEMRAVVEDVRRTRQPDLAFLPLSSVVYPTFARGGANGFCRRVRRDQLDRRIDYAITPAEAAEWARRLAPARVVPYATFVFAPRTVDPAIAKLHRELRARGLSTLLHAAEPMDVFTAHHARRTTPLLRSYASQWKRAFHRRLGELFGEQRSLAVGEA